VLRDKEAARRYRPGIEAFVADHREEIDAVRHECDRRPAFF